MKILWIVNMVMPDLAKMLGVGTGASGTWMIDLAHQLSKMEQIELAIACVYGKKFTVVNGKRVKYYVIPGNGRTMLFYNPSLIKYWEKVESDFKPDIVHIHGTEYTHAISYLRNYPDKKYVLSIQGVVKKVSEKHNGELGIKQLIRYRTLRENLHLSGMIEKTLVSKKNARYEREIIQKVHYATGRTDWDKYFMQSINPNIRYYRCYYNLREEFYCAEKWSVQKADKNRVYVSTAAQTPFKGGHIVLRAIAIVKNRFPKTKFVFLGGKVTNGKLVVTDGYSKYINKLIKKLEIQNNIEFIGRQDTQGVISLMRNCRICIIPSAIENASATMREAMHIGIPVIAAFRGGMINLIDDRKSGYYYDYSEYEYLAGRIEELLQDDSLAAKFSDNEIKIAEKMHDREKNTNDFLEMYNDIYTTNQEII